MAEFECEDCGSKFTAPDDSYVDDSGEYSETAKVLCGTCQEMYL